MDSGSLCQLHLQHILGHLLGLVVCQVLALGNPKGHYFLPQVCVSDNLGNEYNHEVTAGLGTLHIVAHRMRASICRADCNQALDLSRVRYMWVLKLIVPSDNSVLSSNQLTLLLQMTEVTRRWAWIFFRVENASRQQQNNKHRQSLEEVRR